MITDRRELLIGVHPCVSVAQTVFAGFPDPWSYRGGKCSRPPGERPGEGIKSRSRKHSRAWAGVALLLALPLGVRSQTPREIVQRSLALYTSGAPRIVEFTYRMRELRRQYDGSGNLRQTTIRTWEMSFMEGSPYRRLVARNDAPLSAEEVKSEEERMRYTAGQRRKETPAERAKRVGEWRKHDAQQREPLLEVADAFDFKLAGEETVDGEPAYIIDATPKPGYRPKSSYGSYLTKMKARFRIAKRDYQCLKMDAATLDTIAIGGILVRLAKGGSLVMQQARVEEGLCLPKYFAIRAQARVALVKTIRTDLEYTLGDFRRAAR